MESVETRIESTASLLSLVRDGDRAARERLCAWYLPIMQRWAHGRLPLHARDLAETADLVHLTLMAALDQIDEIRAEREGSFLAYLRTSLLNAVRQEIRRNARRGPHDSLPGDDDLTADSPIAAIVGEGAMLDYERALSMLPPLHREAVILRIEFGFSFDEVAAALQKPSANAARMFVGRALNSLAEQLA